ncbi:cilia- and flagella-associated protein 53-like [Uranotaenia lowii]|uniref:cilia- and flagella-associated protein 53-like n=1 Tax=Uranotaenia lowii TaxID=190385 RepID=UPI0024786318|nr:cilia- and flagella-associated protein 53-like [Uranotaenia lowii]
MNIFYPEINIKHEVQKLVETADQAYDSHMMEKRQRLKDLLQTEEMQHQKEALEILQQRKAESLRERENNLLAAKQEKEREREEYVKNKMIQLKINNCDEIRTIINQKCLEDSKSSQLKQINEKLKMKQVEQEEDRIWKEVLHRSYNIALTRELNDKRKHKMLEEKTLQAIKHQIHEKSLKAKQEKVDLQQVHCTSLPFPENDDKLKKIPKCDLAKDLEDQIKTNMILRKKRQEQESEMDKILNEAMQRELEQEKAKRDEQKDIFKKQINQFYQYSQHVQKQRMADEAKMDKLINDVHKKHDQSFLENCRSTRKKQKDFADTVYEIQRKQMSEMESNRKQEREQELVEGRREREIYEKHRQASVEADNRSRLEIKKYRETLKEQIKSATLERERNKKQNQMQTNMLADASARELDFVRSYMKGTYENHFRQHPNRSLLKKKF